MAESESSLASDQKENSPLSLFRRRNLMIAGLVLSDILLINVAFVVAYWIRYRLQLLWTIDPAYMVPYSVFLPFALILMVLLALIYRREGLYRLRHGVSWLDEVYSLIIGTSTGIVIMVALVFVSRPTFYSRLIFFYAGAVIIVLLSFSRLLKAIALRAMRRRGVGVARVIIVGVGEMGRTVMRTIVARPELGYKIEGFVDDDPVKGDTNIGRFPALGNLDNLTSLIRGKAVDEVIITLPWQYHRKIMALMNQCQRHNVRARIVPDLFQMTLGRTTVSTLAGIPLIGIKEGGFGGFTRLMKRVVDIVFSALFLIAASPLLGLIALLIQLDSSGPVFFGQERIGKGGRPFYLYKFRSMTVDAEAKKEQLLDKNEADGPLFKIKDDPRLTRMGRWLRRFSLDELPQFYNVLRGEMSLVGPRPALQEEIEQYQPWHRRRLEISPGLTGLWQVSGRSELPFDEMVLLDIYYIEQWRPALDFKILFRTIPTVIFGDGAY